MEQLDFSSETKYSAIEAAIHLNRYGLAKPFCKGAHVLDAACGEGYGSYLMKQWGAYSVDGIDIDQESVAQARELFKDERLTYTQGTVERLPYEDNVFDLIVSLETMEHVDDAEAFLMEIKRVLKPGGTVILSCPNDNYYYERDNTKNPFHKRTYTFFEFQELAEKYLGSYVDYYLAFALDGFINLPFERRSEPERSSQEDALGLLHHTQCDQVLCVPQERYLNQWNANYYVGVWGKMERANRYSATIAPRETFIDHKDKDYDLLHHLKDIRKIMQEAEEAKQLSQVSIEKIMRERDEVREQVRRDALAAEEVRRSLEMELSRIRVLLDLTKKERNAASEQCQQLQREYDVAEERCQQAQKECSAIEEQYQQVIQERDKAVKECKIATAQLQSLETSKGVRLLKMFYNLRMKIKRIFHFG